MEETALEDKSGDEKQEYQVSPTCCGTICSEEEARFTAKTWSLEETETEIKTGTEREKGTDLRNL